MTTKRLTLLADVFMQELKCKDPKLAEAAEILIGNCGTIAFDALFDPQRPQTRDKIMKISRKSRERQHFRINGVRDKRMRSVGPQGTDRVPDTMNFAKILNRLGRSRGSIARSCELLDGGGVRTLPDAVIASVTASARTCLNKILKLETFVPRLETNGATSDKRKRPVRQKPKRRLKLDKVPRQLKSALALIEKNVRDLPTSSYDLRPTQKQQSVADSEISQIRAGCNTILRLCEANERGPN